MLKNLITKADNARCIEEDRLKKQRKKNKSKPSQPFQTGSFASLKRYYTYLLIDPRSNEVFYVGKGTEDRIFQHRIEAKNNPAETAKRQRLKELSSQGLTEKRVVVGRFDTDKEAFAAESTLIHWVYGKDNLTNDQSGHGADYIRPKGNYDYLPGIDEPELAFSKREIEKRQRYNVIDYLKEIEKIINDKYSIAFDGIDTSREKHTYLFKLMCDVKLCIVTHHNPRKSAAVTIECIQNNPFYKDQIIKISNKTNFNSRNSGRYARIEPPRMSTDLDDLLEKFMESYRELKGYEEGTVCAPMPPK